MNSLTSPQKPWYKHPFVWMIITIPTLAVCVSGTYVYIAYHGQDDLVRDDWYMDGKTLEQDMSRDTQASLGQYRATLNFVSPNTINVKVSSTNNAQLSARMILNFYHATKAIKDHAIILKQLENNLFTATLSPSVSNDLKGKFTIELDGLTWRLRQEVMLPAKEIELIAAPVTATKQPFVSAKHF